MFTKRKIKKLITPKPRPCVVRLVLVAGTAKNIALNELDDTRLKNKTKRCIEERVEKK